MKIRSILFLFVATTLLSNEMNGQNASRLTGRSIWEMNNGNWVLDDSASYHYSPGKGGALDELQASNLPYDSSMRVVLYNGNYLPYRESIQTLQNNNVLTRLTTQNNLSNFVNYQWDAYTYDGNGNRLSDTLQNWNSGNSSWVGQVRRTRTFDVNNNLTSLILENWNGTQNQWDNVNATYYFYTGNLQTDEKILIWNSGLNQWDSSGWRHFTYNTNNKLDTSWYYPYNNGWVSSQRMYYIYDMNNNNTDQWSANWSGTQNSWIPNFHWDIIYNGNNLAVSDTASEWDDVTNVWYMSTQHDYWYDNNGNRAGEIYRNYDTINDVFKNYFVDSNFYNSYNQLTRTVLLYWNTNTNMWGSTNNDIDAYYYYEGYTASVNDADKPAGSLVVYPSPAANVLHIKANFDHTQEVVIAIYDMMGRQVMQWSEKAGDSFSTSIPVSQMAAGTYSLQIRGKDGCIQKKFLKL